MIVVLNYKWPVAQLPYLFISQQSSPTILLNCAFTGSDLTYCQQVRVPTPSSATMGKSPWVKLASQISVIQGLHCLLSSIDVCSWCARLSRSFVPRGPSWQIYCMGSCLEGAYRLGLGVNCKLCHVNFRLDVYALAGGLWLTERRLFLLTESVDINVANRHRIIFGRTYIARDTSA